jgi:TRAP-type C4-dicarboxylate transport system permease small subunit
MAEEKRSTWRKIGQFLIDIPEKYVSSIAFTTLFVVFVLQIFFRYVLNRPLIWPYEVSIFAFIWTAVLGACFAKRHNAHVVFSLVYDKMNPLGQLIFRVIGNSLIVISFAIALYPTYDYIRFMRVERSVQLKITYDIAFGPYLVFMVLIIGRLALDVYKDIRKLVKGEIQ